MSQTPEILPVESWVRCGPDTRQGLADLVLCDPFTGEEYDPRAIPAWLGRTGLDFLREHAAEIDITVLFSMQQADDLDGLSQLQEAMGKPVIFGDVIGKDDLMSPDYVAQRALLLDEGHQSI